MNRPSPYAELSGLILGTLIVCGLVASLIAGCATIPTDCEIARDELAAANRCLADAECSGKFPLIYLARDEAADEVKRYCGVKP